MEHTYLELTILSAADLKRKWLSGDQMVAVAWVDPSSKRATSVVSGNGSNVQWDEKLILTWIDADNLLQGKLLTIEIHAQGTWGDSLLGSVYVPLVELPVDGEEERNTTLMYQIVRPSGKRQGSIKFFAKVMKPRVRSSVVPCSRAVSLPSTPPLEDYQTGNALYPPASGMRPPVETNNERPSSVAYPTLEVSPYPPQPHVSQNYAAKHDARQPYPSHGMGSHPPHVYPPVNTSYPPHMSHPPCPFYSNCKGIMPYPPLSPTEATYPPIAPHHQYPPIAPHPSEMYPPASFNPYSNFSSSWYPPPYPQQQAAVHYPDPSYCGRRY